MHLPTPKLYACLYFTYNLFHNEGIGGGGRYKTQHKETSLNYCKVPVFV